MNLYEDSHIWLMAVNVLAVLWAAYYSAGRLGKMFGSRAIPELLAHTLIVGGGFAVVGVMIQERQPHHWTEILLNVGVASYFAVREWRRWEKERREARCVKRRLKSKPHVKLIIWKGKSDGQSDTES